MKLNVGDKIESFSFDTPFEKDVDMASFSMRVSGKTVLFFLRYYGCTLCQYDLHIIAENYSQLKTLNGQAAVVLQSSRDLILSQVEKDSFPFEIICDPTQALYHKFEIMPAESKAKMADMKTVTKLAKATLKGYKHGEYEGDELQLPAVVIVDNTLTVQYRHYAKTVSDMPSMEDIIELLK